MRSIYRLCELTSRAHRPPRRGLFSTSIARTPCQWCPLHCVGSTPCPCMPWVDSRQQAILKKARACLARQQAESDPSTARDDEDGQQPDEFFLPSRQPNKQVRATAWCLFDNTCAQIRCSIAKTTLLSYVGSATGREGSDNSVGAEKKNFKANSTCSQPSRHKEKEKDKPRWDLRKRGICLC